MISTIAAQPDYRVEEIDMRTFALTHDGAFDHVILTDPEGVIIYANHAAELNTGFSKEEMLGNTPSMWGRQMPTDYYEHMWKTIKFDKKHFAGEITNRRKNGEIYYAEAHISPVLDDKENILFFLGIERDITKLKEVDRMKSEFISVVSHQFRTPLTAIKWYSEMLVNGEIGDLSEQQKAFVSDIRISNDNMIALVETLLNISKIESGKLIIDIKDVNVIETIEKSISLMTPKLATKNQTIIRDFKEDVKSIKSDPKFIFEIFTNLLSNASKYSKDGSDINVGAKIDKNNLVCYVKDNGYGIPQKDQDKIFTKFFRSANVSHIDTSGTGIGLYFIKMVLDALNGRIWFESKEGEGTTFWFSLPI